MKNTTTAGFTLIELSIVLVIIGLIVGGVLVGQDLIRAAAVRSQLSQIEKINTAVNTFSGKFSNYLPGDIPNPDASNFGFAARGPYAGQGDGNGILEGNYNNAAGTVGGFIVAVGETAMFWVDLSTVRMIDDKMNTASSTLNPNALGGIPATQLGNYFPSARIGNNNSLAAYSFNTVNYITLSNIQSYNGSSQIVTSPALSVAQASNMDSKIDDGFPQTGNIVAHYLNGAGTYWAAGGGANGAGPGIATAASATTCYDNGNNASATMQYSMNQNRGAGINCAVSFRVK